MTSDATGGPRLEELAGAVLAVHGDRLDEQQRLTLRQHIERLRAAVGALDASPLTNADEPDFAFRAIEGVDGA